MSSQKPLLITGAGGALGSHVFDFFRKNGHPVIGTDISEEARREGQWITADLSQSDSVADLIARIVGDFPNLYGLIHCAGGFRFSKIEETSDQDFEFLLEANLKSSFYLLRGLIPHFRKNGSGRAVFVSANSTLSPHVGVGAYLASKNGLNGLVKVASQELKETEICVNAVLPSMIDTPANRKDMPDANFENWVTPEQISRLCQYLISDEASAVKGSLIPITGRL